MVKIFVAGATGFVGQACAAALRQAGHDVARLRTPVLASPRTDLLRPEAVRCRPALVRSIADELAGRDVVVNAAGLPHAASRLSPSLFGANSFWPHVLAQACELAGVRRLVHVSTTAVQGRSRVLDDTPRYTPLTPYAESKVLGEQVLVQAARRGRLQVTIYRPPSVHDGDRDLTRSFAEFCRRWPLFVAGDGDQPVSVSLAGNVGAAVVALAEADNPPVIVIHPYEGHTVRSLYETFAEGRPIRPLPESAVRRALRYVEPVTRAYPRTAAASRRVELLLLGQAQVTSWLTATGFRPPLGRTAWRQVALAASRRPTQPDQPDRPDSPATIPG